MCSAAAWPSCLEKLRRPAVGSAAIDFSRERLRRGRPGIAEDMASSGGQCGGVVILSRAVEASSWAVQRRRSPPAEGYGGGDRAVRRRWRSPTERCGSVVAFSRAVAAASRELWWRPRRRLGSAAACVVGGETGMESSGAREATAAWFVSGLPWIREPSKESDVLGTWGGRGRGRQSFRLPPQIAKRTHREG